MGEGNFPSVHKHLGTCIHLHLSKCYCNIMLYEIMAVPNRQCCLSTASSVCTVMLLQCRIILKCVMLFAYLLLPIIFTAQKNLKQKIIFLLHKTTKPARFIKGEFIFYVVKWNSFLVRPNIWVIFGSDDPHPFGLKVVI